MIYLLKYIPVKKIKKTADSRKTSVEKNFSEISVNISRFH